MPEKGQKLSQGSFLKVQVEATLTVAKKWEQRWLAVRAEYPGKVWAGASGSHQ